MADSEKVSSLPSERERFEAWAKRMGQDIRRVTDRPGSTYAKFETHIAWESWQAASAGRQELRDALQKTSDMLSSACFFVPKASGLMPMLDQVEKARATLAKHGG